jgi:hypothetical protein
MSAEDWAIAMHDIMHRLRMPKCDTSVGRVRIHPHATALLLAPPAAHAIVAMAAAGAGR